MAKPDREAIDTFVSITGASESVAVQMLLAHGGDLYQAVDAFSNKRVGNSTRVAPTIAHLDDDIDTDETIPVGKLCALRINDLHDNDNDNDIEEEMVRAAIEASKREVGKVFSDQLFDDEDDWRASFTQLGKPHVEDPDLAHAVSLSLKTAEQEKTLRELGGSSKTEANKSTETEDSPTLVAPRWISKRQARHLERVAAAKALKEEKTRRRNEEYEEMARQLEAKESSLPPEPKMGDENVVSILVIMPNGSRRKRRFLKSDKLLYLFDFVDVSGSVVPGTYKLAKSCSDILSLEQSNLSLEEVGLIGKKEALFLVKIRNVGFRYGK